MSYNDCIERRLLRKGRPDKLKSKKALEIAKKYLETSTRLCKDGYYDQVIITAYTSMFQTARAILFKNGMYEKSHYCVVQYLIEKYVKKNKLEQKYVNWLNSYRIERHDSLYGLDESVLTKQDANEAINKAKEFHKKLKILPYISMA